MPEKPTPQPKSTTGPSSISSVSDLEGCWSSNRGGTTMWYGASQYFPHCFDKSGRTKSLAVVLDNRGNTTKECRSIRQAKMSGKGFILSKPTYFPCPGFFPLEFDCNLNSPGTVECIASSASGKSSFIMHYNADLKP
jgi:hypothetical protein